MRSGGGAALNHFCDSDILQKFFLKKSTLKLKGFPFLKRGGFEAVPGFKLILVSSHTVKPHSLN